MKNDFFKKVVSLAMFAAAVLCAANNGFAQEELASEDEDVPPPLVVLSTAENTQLKSVTDFKERTQLCVQLANERLARAETLTNDADFDKAISELAGYQAVIENGIKYLNERNDDSKKVRDNLKRLELALRAHAPRIETIRRSTPFGFGKYVKAVLNFARDARSRALEAFFSDSVVRSNLSDDAPRQTANPKP